MGLSETKLDTKMVASVKLVNEYKQKKKKHIQDRPPVTWFHFWL